VFDELFPFGICLFELFDVLCEKIHLQKSCEAAARLGATASQPFVALSLERQT
jgi:hypothetical protein